MESTKRIVRRPKVGDLVATNVGWADVVKVHQNGLCLTVHTMSHGTETIERADHGWWVTDIVHRSPAL